MKTLHLAIITGVTVAVMITGILVSEFYQKAPIMTTQTNQTSMPASISNIIIPAGSEDPNSGKNYEPRYLVVVLGVNNTVRWTNESPDAANTIEAAKQTDPLFWNETRSGHSLLLPDKSFNFTFTKVGEFQYNTEPHPWMYGWVLVLPQTNEKAFQTVTLNSSSGVPDPCETFRMPCPFHANNYNFTAQRFGSDIYIEKVTANGVDNYAIIKPNKTCYYPPSYSNSCTNPDDLAILRLVGVDTSIPQENVHVATSGLAPFYLVGEPIDFGIIIKGFGHCDIPSVLVTHQGYIDWQGKTSWPSDTNPCETGMHDVNKKYDIRYLGGPIYLNQSGSYLVHIGYSSNMIEERFNVTSQEGPGTAPLIYPNGTYTGFLTDFKITSHDKLQTAILDSTGTIALSIYAVNDGNLTLTLDPDLTNLVKHGKNEYLPIVLEDGQEVRYGEHLNNQSLIMTIPFHNGIKKIEITIPTSI